VVAELRLAYRRHLLVLAAADLAGEIGVDAVGATLADARRPHRSRPASRSRWPGCGRAPPRPGWP
jgi:hypothetical protein